jgi:hypothetical protein
VTTEIEKAAPIAFPEYLGHENWAELTESAITTKGADLLEAADLTGVPFVITGITIRPGDIADPVSKEKGNYVSLELVTGDEKAFAKAVKRKRIPDTCDIEPGERLVFNDGSTGIRRQIVGLMENLGWIILPEGPEGGKRGESRLDTPPEQWEFAEGNTGVQVRFDVDGRAVVTAPLRVLCERGIRVSEYENDYTKDGKTHYLA